MIIQRFRLRIPEGVMIEEIENSIIKNNYLLRKMNEGKLYGEILKKYNINGEETLVPVLYEDSLKVENILFKGTYIDILFSLEGEIEKYNLKKAMAILRGNYDLRQEKLNIIGIDLLIEPTQFNKLNEEKITKYKEEIEGEEDLYTILEIKNNHGISNKNLYEEFRKDPHLRHRLSNGSLYGELLVTKDLDGFYYIDMSNVSHRVIDVHIKDDKLTAEVKVFNHDIDLSKAYLVPRILTEETVNGMQVGKILTFDMRI